MARTKLKPQELPYNHIILQKEVIRLSNKHAWVAPGIDELNLRETSVGPNSGTVVDGALWNGPKSDPNREKISDLYDIS